MLGKIFLQRLWKDKVDWDEPLSKELTCEWGKIKIELDRLTDLRFPRKTYDTNLPVSLIVCCDSSREVYGFGCYAKTVSASEVRCNLLFAKAKSAPLKQKTLPTLELMSVFLALKCLPSILNAIKNVNSITVCVDAQMVLSLVLTSNVKTKNIFARNRVHDISRMRMEISDHYNLECKFTYIPSEDNPADLLTRGLAFNKFVDKYEFWLHGPKFIRLDSSNWPKQQLGCLSEESKILAVNATTIATENINNSILPVNKFSSLSKLLNITALVFTFICKLKRNPKSRLECVSEAKKYWLKFEQVKHFNNERNFLVQKGSNPPGLVNNLNLFMDENQLIRSKGRLENCDYLSFDARNPILLPKHSHLTDLFVWEAHATCKHLGAASTLAAVRRSGLWIPQGRTIVRSVIAKCVTCKKINAFPFKYPKATDFIKDKVNFTTPFRHTGIDYTGHFL